MADPTIAAVILMIATIVVFGLLIGGVWLATKPQKKKLD